MLRSSLLFAFLLILSACQSRTHLVKRDYTPVAINDQTPSDTSITAMIAPYRVRVVKEMSKIIGEVAEPMPKGQPESTLGNWLADLVHEEAERYTRQDVDFALLNYGGLRIGSIPAGALTKGKIFELLPFDNTIVVLEMPGSELPLVFDHVAQKGGWPVSSPVRMTIANGKGIAVTINGELVDPTKIYRIATNDYIANGGDNSSFFIGKKQYNTGKFIRDVVINYVVEHPQPIRAKLERRISGGE